MKVFRCCLGLVSFLFILVFVVGLLVTAFKTALVVIGALTCIYCVLLGIEFLGKLLILLYRKNKEAKEENWQAFREQLKNSRREHDLERLDHLRRYRKEITRGDEDFADTYRLCFHPVDSEIKQLTDDLGLDQEND